MTQFKLRDDKYGNPVAHAKSCFCPSMSVTGINAELQVWEAEAEDIGALAEDLEADSIASGTITRAEARRMLKLAHCIDAPEGVGRRYAGPPTEELGKWERETEQKSTSVIPKHIREARMAFAETDRKPGRPSTSHSDCDHPVTKSARAACRRQRARNT